LSLQYNKKKFFLWFYLFYLGLKIKPEKGNAILFYNLLPNGQFDTLSYHGGCPILKGEKWAANKWIWTNKQDIE
jgi:prolyl 4-hydroxylase